MRPWDAGQNAMQQASHSSDNDRSEEEKGPLHLPTKKLQKNSDDRKSSPRCTSDDAVSRARKHGYATLTNLFFEHLKKTGRVAAPSPRGNAKAARDSPPSFSRLKENGLSQQRRQ